MAVTIALILTSTVSVMIYVGPRIIQIMGEDIPILKPLATRARVASRPTPSSFNR